MVEKSIAEEAKESGFVIVHQVTSMGVHTTISCSSGANPDNVKSVLESLAMFNKTTMDDVAAFQGHLAKIKAEIEDGEPEDSSRTPPMGDGPMYG